MTTENIPCEVYESKNKRGFHPCDYETFLKLKQLHKIYWATAKNLAAWFRWNAKEPQNRILTKKIKDPTTNKIIGKKIIGPKPEPNYCKIFALHTNYRRDYMTIPEHLNDHGIIDAYNYARIPRPADEVKPLQISETKINELFEKLNEIK